MKKYIFRFGIALFTFGIGVGLVSFCFFNFFSYNPLTENEINKNLVQVQQTNQNRAIIACGMDSFGESVSHTLSTLPDGTELNSTLITSLKSEKSARKRFIHEMKTATRIIEVSPYLDYWKRPLGEKAFVESGGKVIIIKYWKNPSYINKNGYYMKIVETLSLQHARTIDEEQESLERSVIINKLNP